MSSPLSIRPQPASSEVQAAGGAGPESGAVAKPSERAEKTNIMIAGATSAGDVAPDLSCSFAAVTVLIFEWMGREVAGRVASSKQSEGLLTRAPAMR